MKLFIKISLLILLPVLVKAQAPQSNLDSLRRAVEVAANDTGRMNALDRLAGSYDDVNLDSAVYYEEKAITMARQLQLRFDEATMNARICWPIMKMGNYPRALKLLNSALEFTRDPANEKYIYNVPEGQTPLSIRLYWLSYTHETLAGLYSATGNYEKSIASEREAISIQESLKDTTELADTYASISDPFFSLNKLDSALYYCQKAVLFYGAVKKKKYPCCRLYTAW